MINTSSSSISEITLKQHLYEQICRQAPHHKTGHALDKMPSFWIIYYYLHKTTTTICTPQVCLRAFQSHNTIFLFLHSVVRLISHKLRSAEIYISKFLLVRRSFCLQSLKTFAVSSLFNYSHLSFPSNEKNTGASQHEVSNPPRWRLYFMLDQQTTCFDNRGTFQNMGFYAGMGKPWLCWWLVVFSVFSGFLGIRFSGE